MGFDFDELYRQDIQRILDLEDEKEFVRKAKEFNILLVPGSTFRCSGYVRIAYCVSYETVVNSLPMFKKLADVVL